MTHRFITPQEVEGGYEPMGVVGAKINSMKEEVRISPSASPKVKAPLNAKDEQGLEVSLLKKAFPGTSQTISDAGMVGRMTMDNAKYTSPAEIQRFLVCTPINKHQKRPQRLVGTIMRFLTSFISTSPERHVTERDDNDAFGGLNVETRIETMK